MNGPLGSRLVRASAAAAVLAATLSGCSSYAPLEQKDLESSWAAVGGPAGRSAAGPEGILREIRDHTTYSPAGCSVLAGPDVASPYALDDLDSKDPGFSGNFNSPSRSSPPAGSIAPPGSSDYLGAARLFATEQKAADYFNTVAGALATCSTVQTTYQGSTTQTSWAKGAYFTQNTLTWTAGKVGGLMIRKANIIFLAHSVSSSVPDIATDAAKLAQAVDVS